MKAIIVITFDIALLAIVYSLIGIVWDWEYSHKILATSLILFVFSIFCYWACYYKKDE